tara:strand:+ start:1554 stop:1784 length:231 start_codon:yes stop_codon:yes gene_type:complete
MEKVLGALGAFANGALFVIICAIFSGIFTGFALVIIDQEAECREDRASAANYRIEEALAITDIARIRRRVGLDPSN